MNWVDWITTNINASQAGFIHIRLGPGFFRTLHNIATTHSWPVCDAQIIDCENTNGLGRGDLSDTGLPKFIENMLLTKSTVFTRLNKRPEIFISASHQAFKNSTVTDGTYRAKEILSEDIYHLNDELTSGPKTGAVSGDLIKLKTQLKQYKFVFLGPSRIMPFAKAMGCQPDDFFCIPSEGAASLFQEAREFIASRIRNSGDHQVVFMHGASWLGNSLALDIAVDSSFSPCAFSSIDLGLGSAMLDLEFLASRPWFINNHVGLLNSARNLISTDLSPVNPMLDSADVCSFGQSWKTATFTYRENQLDAIRLLDEALDRVKTSIEYFSTAWAILLLWKVAAGILDDDQDMLPQGHIWKAEPALIMATIYAVRGQLAEAERFVKVAERIDFRQPYIMHIRNKLKGKNQAQNIELEELKPMLYRQGRAYLGSSLSWSLWGDYPGSDAHQIRL